MWRLTPEQAARLVALQRRRDVERIAEALAAAFPVARARLADRWGELVEHGVQRAAAYGLQHMLCVARLLGSWIACGADFETRQPWAAAILTDDKRTQGAKAYQLCVLVVEQLRGATPSGPATAADFAAALRQIDEALGSAGTLASLLPRERIRLGSACDLDAVELRLVEAGWRQHYTAQAGPWRRVAGAPSAAVVTLVHDALAEAPACLPEQVTLLSHAPGVEGVAALRVRVRAEHRCDPQLHPLLQSLEPSGTRSLRGDVAADATFNVHARARASESLPHMGEEDSPEFSALSLASCGLRTRGIPIAELSTRLAAYDATQHLVAWRREPPPAWELPGQGPPPVAVPRCRRECDGQVADVEAWLRGLQDLDLQLQSGLARLLTAWERESGVNDGKLAIDAVVLAGTAGITWGWAEAPAGISALPYMRMEGLFDLVACRLALRFTGVLTRTGSRSLLTLSTQGSQALSGPWNRGPEDAALFAAAAKLKCAVHQGFELSVQPYADPGTAILGCAGPVRGAINGSVGLEQRPDGPGLRWFARLNVEPVIAPLRLADPVLGVQLLQQPLLPAHPLVDWSLA